MHQKDRAKQALIDAGLYNTKDAGLKRLFASMESEPLNCWSELATEARVYCGDHLEALCRAVWLSADPLLRVNLIRQARPTDKNDRALLHLAIEHCDPTRDATELRAILELGDPELVQRIAKKPKLTAELRAFIDIKLGKTPKPKIPPPKKKTKKTTKKKTRSE